MAKAGTQRDDQFQRAGDAEDDAHLFPVPLPVRAVSGVFEGLAGGNHAKYLRCVGRFKDVRGEPVLQRVEIDGSDETAALAVGAVRCLGIISMVIGNLPMGRWDLRYGIDAVLYRAPVGGHIIGFRENTADTDDGKRLGGGIPLRCHCVIFFQ